MTQAVIDGPHPVCKQVEITYLLTILLSLPLNKLPGMKWLDCGLKMVSNFGQFGPRIGHNVIQQRNDHVIQNLLVDTSIDFDPWPDFQIHHFNLAPVYFLSCFKKFLGLDLYLQINQNQNWVCENKLEGSKFNKTEVASSGSLFRQLSEQ